MTRQLIQSKRAPARMARWKMEISATMSSLGVAVAFVSLIASPGDSAAARPASAATPVFSRLASIPSHNGRYRASLVPTADAGRQSDPNTWTVEVRNSVGEPVSDAALALETWMPDDDRMPAARPRVTGYVGRGRYRVEGIHFDRRGWWNVRLQIAASVGTDSLAFNLVR